MLWSPVAIYRSGTTQDFPLTATSETDLQAKLEATGHFLALPQEPAALANVIEVALVDFLVQAHRNGASRRNSTGHRTRLSRH